MERIKGFANYGAPQLALLTHTTEQTARRWIKQDRAPRLVLRWLELTIDGDLAGIRPEWDGWTMRNDGRLHSPDGPSFTPQELTAYGLNMQLLRELQRQRVAILWRRSITTGQRKHAA